jgi:hypothetical protein
MNLEIAEGNVRVKQWRVIVFTSPSSTAPCFSCSQHTPTSSKASTGLVFIAGVVGTLIGIPYVGGISDRTLKQRIALGKTLAPEDRLPLIITLPGPLAFPIGVFIYGWGAESKMHWIVPQIGTES